EAFRHSITKMSHLHFPSCEEYKNRIIQMGECPDNVYSVGSLGVENIRKLELLERNELEYSIDFKLDKPFFLITFHPVTLEKHSSKEQFGQLLKSLDQYPDYKFIFTGSNADTGGQVINQMQRDYQKSYHDQCFVIPSLGHLRYLSAMKFCDAVVGNSSSGIIEAPALKVPTINIGDRQKGRLRTHSIIDCDPDMLSILAAMKEIQSKEFLVKLKNMKIPFDKPDTAKKIKDILQKVDLKNILKKQFYDIDINQKID
ncbi:UDP-N-acetylglucosamine 2-epimerase (hydrolyzing), partial [bacterium]|nr:UDP-N-acetylglucosamine 2-epimerase (hydrolyzing) [bacterium]